MSKANFPDSQCFFVCCLERCENYRGKTTEKQQNKEDNISRWFGFLKELYKQQYNINIKE